MRMSKWSLCLLPLLATGAVWAQSSNSPKAVMPNAQRGDAPAFKAATPASAPASAPTTTVRPEVGKPLLEAQALLTDKKFADAKVKVAAAAAMPGLTAYENYTIARMNLVIAVNVDDAAGAESALTQLLDLTKDNDWLKRDDKMPMIQNVAIVNYRTKNYAQAAEWMGRYLKEGGTDANARVLRVQALLLGGNYPATAAAVEEEIAPLLKDGKAPPQNYLEILAQSRDKMKDNAGFVKAMEMLVQFYPKKEYWQTLVNRLMLKQDLATRLQLNLYRLAHQTGTLQETNDYLEFIDLSQKAGGSGEALRVYDEGAAAGLLGKGADGAAQAKQRAKLAQEVEQDRKVAATEAVNAAKKPDGTSMVRLGMNMVMSLDMNDKGLELMEKGIAKGGLRRPEDAQLDLGIAYAKAGQTDKANQAFTKIIGGKEGLDELGRYWIWAIRK